MKKPVVVLLLLVLFFGCQMPQVFRPLRLYDLSDGNVIQVFLDNATENVGTISSANMEGETFHGEFVFYDRLAPGTRPQAPLFRADTQAAIPDNASLAELYGFGKDASIKPAGNAILVGSKGTVIEIVLYRISSDMDYGDGVARDNKGHRYRVFLSLMKQ